MFIYQLLIIGVSIILIYILTRFLKENHGKILVFCILAILTAAGIVLYAIQYYFGNHFYTQEISASSIEQINISKFQKKNLKKALAGFKNADSGELSADAFKKTYEINANGSHSTINTSIYVFSDSNSANSYFEACQKFYENKNYIPLDTLKSKRTGNGERYLISLIKSQYKDYADFFYRPSKITYSSDVTIVYDNVVIVISEAANKPLSNKAVVIGDIKKRLATS